MYKKLNSHLAMKKLWFAIFLTLLPMGATAQPVLPNRLNLNSESSLISPETAVDYASLRNLLRQQRWRDANEQTRKLMLQAANRERQGWITTDNIRNFACWDLNTIDQLWSESSQGHFGLKVQYQIFVDTGNRPGRLMAVEKYQDFGDRIGWRRDDDWIIFRENLNFSLNAPIGHLPAVRREYQITGGRLEYTTLTQRMVECGMVVDTTAQPTPTWSVPNLDNTNP